jgi:RHH-type proline utilization regulon transcriptional repressor/proline dehydrogenase/delta 1-pyrroline-5-carboxylate dehydrogenase
MTTDNEIESEILEFGKNIFHLISTDRPSVFQKAFWSAKLLQWSMTNPKFKVQLFRLVDVLPTLRSSKSIAEHIRLYLAEEGGKINRLIGALLNLRSSSPLALPASYITKQSVEQMASDMITGATPNDAIGPLIKLRQQKMAFTVDLLGEYSVSELEAVEYQNRYFEALEVMVRHFDDLNKSCPIVAGHPGEVSPICISVKLSALYSQISTLNFSRSVSVLSERLASIVDAAQQIDAQVYVDAEDSAFNPVIYETFKQVFGCAQFKDYPYPGMVVQAYAKNSEFLINDLLKFAHNRSTPIAIRLVKGAYWDAETIGAKANGWESPLFAHKESSDANFEKLTRLLIDNHNLVLPAIASHNVRSLSHACIYAAHKGLTNADFELQMLYGMADPIAKAFTSLGYLVRLYSPIGLLIPGMGYLVRRLLENTSNESFLRHTFFDKENIDQLLRKPLMKD